MTRRAETAPPGAAMDLRHDDRAPWSPAARLAFRFGVIYLTLFGLATQISGSLLPNLFVAYRGAGERWPMRELTEFVARSVVGTAAPLDAGSRGEPLFFWMQTAWILAVSLAAAAIWTAVDRRTRYPRLLVWFRFGARLALAAALLEYGMTKVIPTQFPEPPLATLVTPAGHLTLSALLWTSIGASPAYEIFTGCVEVAAAILLLIPRTATLGAVVGVGALVQVLALNMAYDIGLKLTTLHLIALALIVLGLDLGALANFFVRHRPAHASAAPLPVTGAQARRVLLAAQFVFGAYLLGMYAYINWSFWQVAGGGRPRSALYGIWDVDRLAVDGQAAHPDSHDYDRRWRRVIFDDANAVVFQRTDDSLFRYGASIDPASGTISLTKGNSRTWSARITFDRPAPNRLRLEGHIDGHDVEADLRQVDLDAFPVLHSSFRWVRPHD